MTACVLQALHKHAGRFKDADCLPHWTDYFDLGRFYRVSDEHISYVGTLAKAKLVPVGDLTACHGTAAQLKMNKTLFTPRNLAVGFAQAEREGIVNLTFASLYQPHRRLIRPCDLRAAGLTFNESAMRRLTSSCWLHLRREHLQKASAALRSGNYVAVHMRLKDGSISKGATGARLGKTVARWTAALFEMLAQHFSRGTAVFIASGVSGGVCVHKRTDARLTSTFACTDGEIPSIRSLWPRSAEIRDISMVAAAKLGMFATFYELDGNEQDFIHEAHFAAHPSGSVAQAGRSSLAGLMLSAWNSEHAPEEVCRKEQL